MNWLIKLYIDCRNFGDYTNRLIGYSVKVDSTNITYLLHPTEQFPNALLGVEGLDDALIANL